MREGFLAVWTQIALAFVPALVIVVAIFLNMKLRQIHTLVNSRLHRIERALEISEEENVELRRYRDRNK